MAPVSGTKLSKIFTSCSLASVIMMKAGDTAAQIQKRMQHGG